MTPVVVAGVGSPFGADRLGWDAVARLRTDPFLQQRPKAQLRMYELDRPGPALLDYLNEGPCAIVIDAVQNGLQPGALIHLENPGAPHVPKNLSSHELGLADTLALGQALGALPQRLIVIGIEAGDPPADDLQDWPDRAAHAALTELQTLLPAP